MRDTRGFTLIEVLVVLVLLGVLSGIAIAQYDGLRAHGFDGRVTSVVRAVATGQEAYFATHGEYAREVGLLDGVVLGDVLVSIEAGNSGDLGTSFRATGHHPHAAHSSTWVSDPPAGQPNLLID